MRRASAEGVSGEVGSFADMTRSTRESSSQTLPGSAAAGTCRPAPSAGFYHLLYITPRSGLGECTVGSFDCLCLLRDKPWLFSVVCLAHKRSVAIWLKADAVPEFELSRLCLSLPAGLSDATVPAARAWATQGF